MVYKLPVAIIVQSLPIYVHAETVDINYSTYAYLCTTIITNAYIKYAFDKIIVNLN